MHATGRIAATATVVGVCALLPASAALAAEAEGCQGSVQSLMADGSSLDSATAPGAGGTADDPLVIDPDGSIAWEGSTDVAITSGTWSVTVGGVPFRSGDVDNADGDTSGSGVVDLAGAPDPVQWVLTTNARIPVEGSMSGPEGTCTASGYLAGTGGSPISSPVFIAGAGLAAFGALGVVLMAVGTKAGAAGAAAAGGAGA
ncbi:MAG: hypothetical protein Q8M17_06070 [Actinomycetota bacterium]|nr:hypothetical protein [Actinomycetota bacterium]